ncbi:MAG TPA: phosphoglycerate kinase [Nitrospira sp.]|nr:phosphoglycerate kinase [Nitrospira sp.]
MKRIISDLPDDRYRERPVLVRVDFNVPLDHGQIREDYRLRQAIPTIEYLSQRGAKVMLASHLGKPKGKVVPALSLKPVADRLGQILRVPAVKFVDAVVGESVKHAVTAMKPGEVLLLENLRFEPGEEANDPVFAKQLASMAELYVNDAFGTMHRTHASTYGAAQLFAERAAGFLVGKEMDALSQVRDRPARPFRVVVGGIKIKDKLSALKALLPKADSVLLGSGIAYTFLAAEGVGIGNSPVEPEFIPWAKDVLAQFRTRILLPEDHVIATDVQQRDGLQLVHREIPAGFIGLDIGRNTALTFSHALLRESKTIFWNGPLGAFEVDECADGTVDIARAIALAHWRGAFTVVGGGDTVAAVRKAEVLETEISHVSTGGGAALKFIGGEELPGIAVLSEQSR